MADNTSESKKVVVPKTAADVQRIKLGKLMKNPKKPVIIPEQQEEKKPRVFTPPEFIRNIWGSSAGAGSGDFHVYRGVRRREYARQKYENEMSEKDKLDAEAWEKTKILQKECEDKTAKKRAKRQKQKAKLKNKKIKMEQDKKKGKSTESKESSSEEEETDENEEEKEGH